MPMFAICVGGVPGVGKTALLKAHVQQESRDQQITGSSIVKKIISPSTVQDMDSWDVERRKTVREQSIQKLRMLQLEGVGRLLVDGHFTLRNRSSGLVESIFTREDRTFFQALILVDAIPEDVFLQRATDKRGRRLESVAEIAAHIKLERAEVRRLAKAMKVPLLELLDIEMSMRLKLLADFLNAIAPLKTR